MGIRVVPNETVPREVARCLLPHERSVVTVRKHPAALAGATGLFAASAAVAGLVTAKRREDLTALRGAWTATGIALAGVALRALGWYNDYLVVTNSRVLYVRGFIGRKATSFPLRDIREVELHRPLLGRLAGYGTLVLKSPDGQRKIRFLPYPEQLHLEVAGLLFPDPDSDDD